MGLDPNYLYDNSDVIWYGTEGYANALNALMKVTGKSDLAVEMNLNAKYGAADYWTAMQALEDHGVVVARNNNGYRCFAYQDSVMTTSPTGPMYATDSNSTATTMVKASPVYDTAVDTTVGSATEGKVLVNPAGSLLTSEHGFYGWKFFAGECFQGISAASIGITLGKAIDSALYNANPDYWDSIGMQTLNPETWNSITNGDDSFAAGLFNMIFGLDPNTGKAQAFIDENAFSYLAYALAQNGWFNQATTEQASYNGTNLYYQNGVKYTQPINISNGFTYVQETDTDIFTWNVSMPSDCYMVPFRYGNSRGAWVCSKNHLGHDFHLGTRTDYYKPNGATSTADITYSSAGGLNTWNGNRFYDNTIELYMGNNGFDACFPNANIITDYFNNDNFTKDIATIIFDGTITSPSSISGVSNQDNANLPDVSTWDSPQNVLSSLQNQYPDLWDNAVPNTVVQPDGSTQTITYIPIALPQINNQWDTQPTTNPDSTQSNPQVQPKTEPTTETNDLLRTIIQLITMPQPQPDPETQTQPQEQPQPYIPTPPSTGEGDSPTPVPPTGNASALWSVYHPTQAQVNSFGAWLWGSPFLTNIGKLFTNPIDGVISLHKIFVTPVDSGNGTIVVGTLDSQVPSATVNQQYVYVDCGSVSCSEYFGTVFDYPPFTNVSLYLPFIGIVPLDTSDVMRSTINVKYGVDVYTGACLAMVEISRDGSTVNMYQYAGVASVEYPLSNVQNGQLVSGLLAIGAGVASMVSTGGITAPAVGAVAAGMATSAKSSVSKSGGFSGNSGAMGIKKPYLIIQRPQVKTANTFPRLEGYPTNYSCKLGNCSNHVKVKSVHVEGIPATDTELSQIETLLKDGVLI